MILGIVERDPLLPHSHDSWMGQPAPRHGPGGSSGAVRAGLSRWACAIAAVFLGAGQAHAQRIENGTAVFAALDKVTAKISKLEVKLGETTRFGALNLTPRACYSRSPTEPPKTTSFVEVDEIGLDGKVERIFSGWMFAESPGLNAVEHPVFDLWLTECVAPLRAPGVSQRVPGSGAPSAGAPAGSGGQPPQDELPEEPRRRPRR